jgi:predicted nucleic acid-binding protein
VLLAAVRGEDEAYQQAMDVLDNPERSFVSSVYVRLETLPNAVFFNREDEVEACESFFDEVVRWVPSSPELSSRAFELACQYGLGAMDALHVAATEAADAELVTAEKPTKPMFRVGSPRVLSIRTVEPEEDV